MMQVILLEKIQNLGGLGETVSVKPGYARNFLIPRGKAVVATDRNLADFEARRADLEAQAATILGSAQARAVALDGSSVTVTRKAGEEGKLFGSVGAADVAEALSATGTAVERAEVRMPSDSIRQLGEFDVELQLHPDVVAKITLLVEAEA
jgi:large subunit ribosomal protein L9